MDLTEIGMVMAVNHTDEEKVDPRSALQLWWDESDFTDKAAWAIGIIIVGSILLGALGFNTSPDQAPLDSEDNPTCIENRSC
jgi:hypothetical protein